MKNKNKSKYKKGTYNDNVNNNNMIKIYVLSATAYHTLTLYYRLPPLTAPFKQCCQWNDAIS